MTAARARARTSEPPLEHLRTPTCRGCDHMVRAPAPAFLCSVKRPSDGLPAMCVGQWIRQKHHYLGRYIDIFNSGMRNQWRDRSFLDIFAGPGLATVREEEVVIRGSPLLALEHPIGFTRYVFVEENEKSRDALEERCRAFYPSKDVRIIPGDCNMQVEAIREALGRYDLCLAFIDPADVQPTFDTIRTLTRGCRMDLIINFPLAAIQRNLSKFMEPGNRTLDDYYATSQWREAYWARPADATLIQFYQRQLQEIGYDHLGTPVKVSTPDEHDLYYLLFASRHPRGADFWEKIRKTDPAGRRSLPGF